MPGFLVLSRIIDAINLRIGKVVSGHPRRRYHIRDHVTVRRFRYVPLMPGLSCNGFCFGTIFLLCLPCTLLSNEHIRIHIIRGTLPKRWRDFDRRYWSRVFPVATIVMVVASVPFVASPTEQSMNANRRHGGELHLDWLRAAVPAGHLGLIKRAAVMKTYSRSVRSAASGIPAAEARPSVSSWSQAREREHAVR